LISFNDSNILQESNRLKADFNDFKQGVRNIESLVQMMTLFITRLTNDRETSEELGNENVKILLHLSENLILSKEQLKSYRSKGDLINEEASRNKVCSTCDQIFARIDDIFIPRTEKVAMSAHAADITSYYQRSHAIIIGISEYQEESRLPNAQRDAETIKKVLEKQYDFNVIKFLLNEEATADHIRELFYDVLQDESKIGHRDRLLIYYSGHGKLRKQITHEGQEVREGYIVPCDSKRNKYSSNIPMKDVVEGCQKCFAKHVLLILDCCYSGYAATRGRQSEAPKKVTETYVKDISSRRAIQVLAAGQEDEVVSDSGTRPGYSAFTGALLDILQPEEDVDNNGILTASEIGLALEQRVSSQKGKYQRPAYCYISGSQGGDFIFRIFNR
jgi:caspase domain-containing protein